MFLNVDATIIIHLNSASQGVVMVNGEKIGHNHVTEQAAVYWIKKVIFSGAFGFPRAPRPFKTRLPAVVGILERSRQTYYVTLHGAKVGGGHRTFKAAKEAFQAFYGVPFEGEVDKPTEADMRDLEQFED